MRIVSLFKDKFNLILKKIISDRLILIFDNIIYSLQWYKRVNRLTLTKMYIEFSNYCNLRCTWCNLDHSKKKINMSEALLDKFLENFISDKRFRSVKELDLWNAGEPLIHPDFIKMLQLIKKYKLIAAKKGISFPRVCLLTNGTLLNERTVKAIFDTNIIGELGISVDGGSKEKYEAIRVGAKWETLEKNVLNLIKINQNRIPIRIICVIEFEKERNIDWMSKEFKNILNSVTEYDVRYPHTWDGSTEFSFSSKSKAYYKNNCCFCKYLQQTLILLPTGDIIVCCADANSKGIIGNLYESDLYSIYNSKKRKLMIRKIRKGRKNEVNLCKNCIGRKFSPFQNWYLKFKKSLRI